MSSVDKTTAQGQMQGVGCGGGLGASAPTGQKYLIPFKLRIHDDDPRHPQGRELGTVWVEIPHDEIAARVKPDIPGQHWEYIAQEEKYAAESICADLSCSIDIDPLHSSPNAEVCRAGRIRRNSITMKNDSTPQVSAEAPSPGVGSSDLLGSLRVWWIPQVPMKPFHVAVRNVTEAKLLLDTLAKYDIFQFENRIKPDYCNTGGLEVFEDGEWSDWYDEDGNGIDETESA